MAAVAGWIEAAEIPDDAPGRVAFLAGEPAPPPAPPAQDLPPGSIAAADLPAPLRHGSPAVGLLSLTGWPAVALVSVALIVLFIVGMRLTR
ncbi:MAG TPA: hypothetical protein VI316_00390 [Candidatus Dormibacteraeota bacterium]